MRQLFLSLLYQLLDLLVFVARSRHACLQVSEAVEDLACDLVLVVVLDDVEVKFATHQLKLCLQLLLHYCVLQLLLES